MLGGILALDSFTLLAVLAVSAVGAVATWRMLAGLIDHATRVHDTRVRVAELQNKYLDRARIARENLGTDGHAPIEVGEADDPIVVG